jgi:hypothetical protein
MMRNKLTLVVGVATLVERLVFLNVVCFLSLQLLSFLLNVKSDLSVCHLKSTVDQNVAQAEEDKHKVRLRLAISVVELACKSVTLYGSESPEEHKETSY